MTPCSSEYNRYRLYMRPRVLYFHGFASSPRSAKIAALRPLLATRDVELIAPDLNVPSFEQLDFDAVVAEAARVALASAPRVLVGSSLGALVALGVARRGSALPMVLIAPALGVARRWSERMPDSDPVLVFNHARGNEVPIHRKFFEQMASLNIDDAPPPSRVVAVMGREDETVPFSIVRETWDRWKRCGLAAESRLIEVPHGDHSLLTETTRIAELILELVQDTAGSGTRGAER